MSAPSTTSDPALGSRELGDLVLQIDDLRQRVSKLEERLGTAAAAPKALVGAPPLLPTLFDLPPNPVPVLGRMVLAIAGAYILRALTDWQVLPAAAGVAAGLVYALVWLWVAAGAPAKAKFAAIVSCSTSMLIMAPLVWEATGRLNVMSSATSSAVLTSFALVALVLGSRKHRIIGTIAGVTSIVMAIVLLLVRDDIVPFTVALLLIAGATEFAAQRDLRPGSRPFAALAADFTVLLFSYLMSGPHGMPETWIPASLGTVLSVQLLLMLIYVGSAVTESVLRRKTLAFVEVAQTATALLIGIGGEVWVFKEHRAVMLSLGIAALIGGIAFYGVSFLLLERDNKWNFRALSTFGLFLVLAGIFLPFSRSEFWILSCACAVGCCWASRWSALPTLGLHGAVYLLLGSAAASATSRPLPVLFAGGAGSVDWLASMGVLVAAATSWAAIAGISPTAAGYRRNQISSLALAAHVVWIATGLTVYAILALWRRSFDGAAGSVPADTVGTVVLAGLSLSLAWLGTRWRKSELVWLLYGIMALCGYKLATRDFMNEHNLALVVSLLCYGGALIVLPRLLRGKSAERVT